MTRERSREELAVELLTAYRNWIGLAALVVVGTVAVLVTVLGVSLPRVEITRDQKVFVLSSVLLGMAGYFPLAKIYEWIYNPPKRYIVSLGLSGEPGIYELSPKAWQNVDVIEDELYQWEGMAWPTYEAEDFDPESMTAVGTWRGSKPDSELLRYDKKLEEVRDTLEEQADTSIDTEIQISSRVRQAVQTIGRAIIDEHASATTYNGDRVADVLADIRKDVEQDTGDPTPQRNGQKPIQKREQSEDRSGDDPVTESMEALAGLEEALTDGGDNE